MNEFELYMTLRMQAAARDFKRLVQAAWISRELDTSLVSSGKLVRGLSELQVVFEERLQQVCQKNRIWTSSRSEHHV
jgi:hypothetical protein